MNLALIKLNIILLRSYVEN